MVTFPGTQLGSKTSPWYILSAVFNFSENAYISLCL